jgi:hypothetical protein
LLAGAAVPTSHRLNSFIETRLFTKLVLDYLSDDAYAALQEASMRDPEAGPVIPGSGGVIAIPRRCSKWRSG